MKIISNALSAPASHVISAMTAPNMNALTYVALAKTHPLHAQLAYTVEQDI